MRLQVAGQSLTPSSNAGTPRDVGNAILPPLPLLPLLLLAGTVWLFSLWLLTLLLRPLRLFVLASARGKPDASSRGFSTSGRYSLGFGLGLQHLSVVGF